MMRKKIGNQNAILPIAFLMVVACHSPRETAVTPKQPAATNPALAANTKDISANEKPQKMPHIDITAGQPLPNRGNSGETLVTPKDYKKAHLLPPPKL